MYGERTLLELNGTMADTEIMTMACTPALPTEIIYYVTRPEFTLYAAQ